MGNNDLVNEQDTICIYHPTTKFGLSTLANMKSSH
jgi:hypothetical protein